MTDFAAPIKEVTVYADRALITRVGSMQLAAGEHELCVNDLPSFLRESLRASGQGPQGTRILDVDISTTFHSRPPESELLALQAACDLLQQRVDIIRARQEALSDRRQWLRALGEHSREFAKGLASGQMKPQECADFFSFTANQALENAETEQELGIQLKQVRDELSAKQRELASKQGYGLPDRLAAVVAIEMPIEGEFTLEVSYLVTQASWRPQYDVRVDMDEDGNQGQVELAYIGQVQQSTGEDWRQVNLALSTARPSQASRLPELQPIYLNPDVHLYRLAASTPSRKMTTRLAAMSPASVSGELKELGWGAQADEPEPPAPAQAEIATAITEQSGTAYVFRIARSVDIPSDNLPHKTTVARDDLPCEFDYVSAPTLDPAAHLRARITNTTERVLLPGSSSIFLSGEYVGTTQIKMTAPREQFKLFLGIDDTIKVKRERIERTVEKGALLQSDLRRTTYAYRITLHNYATFPRTIVLRDQIPVSQHERLKIKMLSMQPQPAERTKLELLTWRFTLPADGEYKLEYRFMLEHPQDMQVGELP
jgi:uncharacterized protein (TIGR02231 family)